MMGGALSLLYGAVAYVVFLGTFLYLIAFVGDLPATGLSTAIPVLGDLVPRTVDSGPGAGTGFAVAVNLLLLAVFGIQHSVMARPGFKKAWTRVIPRPVERSTYVLISSLVLILLFWQWHPIDATVWSVEAGAGRTVLWSLFGLGVATGLVSTFLIDHFELFGLRQVWAHATGRQFSPPGFQKPALYRFVRHPLYVGFLFFFWATPEMTAGHLLFSAGMTGYILVGARFEERDLERFLGEAYRAYRRRVPMLVPGLKLRASAEDD